MSKPCVNSNMLYNHKYLYDSFQYLITIMPCSSKPNSNVLSFKKISLITQVLLIFLLSRL